MTLLQIEALRVKLQSVEVLRGISLALGSGEMIGLLGRNGAGKTTTLRAVMGLVAASGGRITCGGADLTALPTHRRAALGIGYMPEDRRLVPQLSVEENVLLPTWVTRGVDPAARLDFVYGLMPEVAAMRERKALVLSGGTAETGGSCARADRRYASSAAGRTLRRRSAGALATPGRGHRHASRQGRSRADCAV